MKDDSSKTNLNHQIPPEKTKDDSELIHMMGIGIVLRGVDQRLASVEEKIDRYNHSKKTFGSLIIEIVRLIFGGWPAFALVFLILFHTPLRNALDALPDKVKTAQEIGVLGVSLKSTIKVEAEKVGAISLSKTIPKLSNQAINYLFKVPNKKTSLISYSPNQFNEYERINFPSESKLESISELHNQGLAKFGNRFGEQELSPEEIRKQLDQFIQVHPGKESSSNFDERPWILDKPIPRNVSVDIISIYWELTELGRKARKIIISSVANELEKSR